jgi:hypothetical protein
MSYTAKILYKSGRSESVQNLDKITASDPNGAITTISVDDLFKRVAPSANATWIELYAPNSVTLIAVADLAQLTFLAED